VKGDGVVLPYFFKDTKRPAAGIHIIFTDGLKPIHGRPILGDLGIMLAAKADAAAHGGRRSFFHLKCEAYNFKYPLPREWASRGRSTLKQRKD
jgi:hypothetical protein